MKCSFLFIGLLWFVLQGYCGNVPYLGRPPAKRALIIAISKYDRDKTGWSEISSENDVPYIEKALRSQGFTTITIIRDEEATKQGILNAIDTLIWETVVGDVIYLHYSGHGQQIQDDDGDEPDGLDEALVPFDAPVSIRHYQRTNGINATYDGGLHLRDDQVTEKLNLLRTKSGKNGQVFFTIDASHTGPDNPTEVEIVDEDLQQNTFIAFRGGFLEELENLSNKNLNDLSPLVVMTATLANELNYETKDEDGKPVGAFSYALFKTMTVADSTWSYLMVFDEVRKLMKGFAVRQNPTIAGFVGSRLFHPYPDTPDTPGATGNAWVLSIGVSDYQWRGDARLEFTSCVSDAISIDKTLSVHFKKFAQHSGHEYYSSVLSNSEATREKIISAINNVISNSKPDDYFVFSFMGSTIPVRDTSGNQTTWFVPYGLKNILDTAEVKQKGIPLTKLKDLLQLVPANNQLFITEAGPTTDFRNEFIKALIESNPSIASISGRNRIIMVPEGLGYDAFPCKDEIIRGGPFAFFLSKLPSDVNMYQLFASGAASKRVVYALKATEVECRFTRQAYTNIFFEREFFNDLKYFLPDDVMRTRGATVDHEKLDILEKKIRAKHALVIGTNKYQGQGWSILDNPTLDAIKMAEELTNSYGYRVKLLQDPKMDGIYDALAEYSHALDSLDQLIIYIAGHGDFDDFLDDGMIVCHDSKSSGADKARNSYIPYSKLTRMINKLPPKHIFVVLDVCFGGTFDEKVARMKSRAQDDLYANLTSENYLDRKLNYRTRLFLSSGGKREVPEGYRGKHSPFALEMLRALRDQGGSYGVLTASDIFQYVKKLPSEPLLGSFGDDEPGSEFILLVEQKPVIAEKK